VGSKTNVPVICKGEDLIIVNIGSRDKYQPSDGLLSGKLVAAGVDARAISNVVFISADAATNEIASFRHPKARFGYDAIQDLAIKNRVRLIDRAAFDRTELLGDHWTYPGVGFAERARCRVPLCPCVARGSGPITRRSSIKGATS
jgi:hypothetical protein